MAHDLHTDAVGRAVTADLGTIEIGKRTDLTLFSGDVCDLVPKGGQAMREAVRQVWVNGRTVHQAA